MTTPSPMISPLDASTLVTSIPVYRSSINKIYSEYIYFGTSHSIHWNWQCLVQQWIVSGGWDSGIYLSHHYISLYQKIIQIWYERIFISEYIQISEYLSHPVVERRVHQWWLGQGEPHFAVLQPTQVLMMLAENLPKKDTKKQTDKKVLMMLGGRPWSKKGKWIKKIQKCKCKWVKRLRC